MSKNALMAVACFLTACVASKPTAAYGAPQAQVRPCAGFLATTVPAPIAARVTCYQMQVPQARIAGQGSLPPVNLAFSVLEPPGGATQPDPLLVLSGGLGAPVARQGFGYRGALAKVELLAPGRRIILIDHRGAGLSQPLLACDQVSPSVLSDALPTDEVLAACKQTLAQAGILPALFTATQAAQDAIDVRHALGIREWNVFGFSYGTTQALELLRRDGAAIRSIALDGVSPPDANGFAADYRLDPLLDTFAACDADPACHAAFPSSKRLLAQILRSLPDDPSFDPYSRLDLTLTRQRFMAALRVAVEFPDFDGNSQRGAIPAAIDAAASGDYSLWEPMAANLDFSYPPAEPPAPSTPLNFASYVCTHDVGWRRIANLLYPPNQPVAPIIDRSMWSDGQNIPRLCAGLAIERGPLPDQLPVFSARPALVLNGEIDTATPRTWGVRAAHHLKNSTTLTFTNTGHTSILQQFDCAQSIVSAFVAAPAASVNTACIAALPATQWLIP